MLVFRRCLIIPFVLCFIGACLILLISCGDDNPQGPEEIGSTVDTIPPAAVTDLSVKSPMTESVVLVWIAPGDDGSIGTASQYDIRCSTSSITEQNWDSAIHIIDEPFPRPAGQPESFLVSGLESDTDYYFALKTSDDVLNESGLSNIATSKTVQESTPPSDVTDLAAVAIDDSTFTLTWTAPGDNGTSGTASQYDICYSTSRIREQNWDVATQITGEPQPKPGGQWENFTVTGFAASTNYFFALKTADEVPNWSGISNLAPAIGHSVDLWIYPTTLHAGSEIQIIYRVSSEHATALSVACGAWDYQCGDPAYRRLVMGTYPTGIYHLSFDFFESRTGNYMPQCSYFISLCWDIELRANIQVDFFH